MSRAAYYGISTTSAQVEATIVELELQHGRESVEHAMFVDDMEGTSLRETIEANDRVGAQLIVEVTLKSYPRGGYNPFVNGFTGTAPTGTQH